MTLFRSAQLQDYDPVEIILSIAKIILGFIGIIQDLDKVELVVLKGNRKKTSYLISTNLHLSAFDIVRYYARRWKIEQMIKNLKQRLGFVHYQVRNHQVIQRHMALALLSYCILLVLKSFILADR